MDFEITESRHQCQAVNGAGDDDGDAAFATGGKVLTVPYSMIIAVHNVFYLFIEILAGNREVHIAVVSDKELKTEFFFHVCNMLTHCGLCDEAFFGCTRKIQALSCTDEVF